MTVRISGVINTLNEAENIRYAVASLRTWCDEVVVVDQESDDDTAAIARSMGARVVTHARTTHVEPARRFAVAQTSGEWVIILDADEMVPAPLGRRLRAIADGAEPVDAVSIANVNILLGRWTRYGKWWPGRKPRYFRRGALRFSGRTHAGIQVPRGLRLMELPAQPRLAIWHFSYHSLEDLVDKTNRYTTIEARERIAAKRPPPGVRELVFRPIGRLWREYVRGRGYRDGSVGLVVGVTRAYYSFLLAAKEWDERHIAERMAAQERLRRRLLAGVAPAASDDAASDPGAISRSAGA